MSGLLVFTGTRRGMSTHQKDRVRAWLEAMKPEHVTHGGCEGADWDLHQILLSLRDRGFTTKITVHASDLPRSYPGAIKKALPKALKYNRLVDPEQRADIAVAWQNLGADQAPLPCEALDRNRWMIDTTIGPDEEDKIAFETHRILVATPKTNWGEELRSGTWATVRYARKRELPVLIIRPNGSYVLESPLVPFTHWCPPDYLARFA